MTCPHPSADLVTIGGHEICALCLAAVCTCCDEEKPAPAQSTLTEDEYYAYDPFTWPEEDDGGPW